MTAQLLNMAIELGFIYGVVATVAGMAMERKPSDADTGSSKRQVLINVV